MSRWTLLFRTLLFHWRTNLAVGLGVVAGTAVIGGALIVGDSVRGSLRDMTLARLGPIDIALTAPRFFREDLAALLQSTGNAPHCVPAIIAQGTFEKRSADGLRVETRAGRVNVIGLDERLWRIFDREQPGPQADEVFLSSRLARVAALADTVIGHEVR